MDLLTEVGLGLGFIQTLRNLLYFSLQGYSSDFQGPSGFNELSESQAKVEPVDAPQQRGPGEF